MKIRGFAAVCAAALMGASMNNAIYAEPQESVSVVITPSEGQKPISPYIYGVNSGVNLKGVRAKAFRLGGNRLSAYNWENNMSNAGSDWYHTSDLYLVQSAQEQFKDVPGGAALNAAYEAKQGGVPYTLLTLQMLGYVSSDKTGAVKEENAAPSEYWNVVENRKDGELSLEPDKEDGVVYMDEYLNYLISKLGKSDSETGIKAYALDNEPSLWQYTHSLVQGEALTCAELLEKSVDLASVVKDADGGAEVFGPSLFGYSAFDSFAGAPDWQKLKRDNGYRWFIDCYLDGFRKAEEESGERLLDVLDIHYYTEAKGACGERSCRHYDNDDCIRARLDSVRSLYDETYREDSWITDTGAEFFPLLPNIEQSIDKYYPGTKIAFTEYDFGGGDHISGAVAEADMLGIFAEHGVYFASIWSFDKNLYQLAAINMFTNCDGEGGGFGDTLVKSEYGDGDISVYSSIDGTDEGKVKIIITNRSIHEETPVEITLSSDIRYSDAEVYSLYGDSPVIKRLDGVENISGNSFSYTLPALSVTELIVNADEASRETENGAQEETESDGTNGADGSAPATEQGAQEGAKKGTARYIVPIASAAVCVAALVMIIIGLLRRRR
ncbi:MAG: glycoside hydrolase [Butyrivibrio sp.]|nr:glycoside hydrolase [Butyrivibrio sp.]